MSSSPKTTSSLFICCLFYLSHWGCFCGRIWGVFSQLMGMAAKSVLQLSWGHFHCRVKAWIWMKICFEVLNRQSRGVCWMWILDSTVLYFPHWQQRKLFYFQQDTANSTAGTLSCFRFSPGKLFVWVFIKYPLNTAFLYHPMYFALYLWWKLL